MEQCWWFGEGARLGHGAPPFPHRSHFQASAKDARYEGGVPILWARCSSFCLQRSQEVLLNETNSFLGKGLPKGFIGSGPMFSHPPYVLGPFTLRLPHPAAPPPPPLSSQKTQEPSASTPSTSPWLGLAPILPTFQAPAQSPRASSHCQ